MLVDKNMNNKQNLSSVFPLCSQIGIDFKDYYVDLGVFFLIRQQLWHSNMMVE